MGSSWFWFFWVVPVENIIVHYTFIVKGITVCYNPFMDQVTFRLHEILAQRGLKPRQFALKSGINYVTVLRICRNETHGITLFVIARLCHALSIQPGELFEKK